MTWVDALDTALFGTVLLTDDDIIYEYMGTGYKVDESVMFTITALPTDIEVLIIHSYY